MRRARFSSSAALLALAAVAVAPALTGSAGAQPGDSSFVASQGTFLTLDGYPYHFAGANCYYLMTYAADLGLRSHVDEVLTEAAAMGLTVVRTWAFNDGSGWNALQTAPGVYDETVFQGLDYVLDRSAQLGLRVILPLVNNWVDYGGMDQYVTWSATASFHDDFYTDTDCRSWYRGHAAALVNRINTRNGRLYREDPTILAWELANEPRCASDPSGATLENWIDEMSAHLQAIDPNHLVTTGVEGFFNDGTGPWYLNGSEGTDFIAHHQVAGIDFATAHSWPDNWGLSTQEVLDLLSRQARESKAILQKPMILEEFGKLRDEVTAGGSRARYDPRTYFSPGVEPYPVPGASPVAADTCQPVYPSPSTTAARDLFFRAVYDTLEAHLLAGSSYWIAYHDAYPDYDGYGVYYPADVSTLDIITTHAAFMNAAGGITGIPPKPPAVCLSAVHPNPFREAATVLLVNTGTDPRSVFLGVFDAAGRRIRILENGPLPPGTATVRWDGRDAAGRRVSAGVYFFRAIWHDAGPKTGTSKTVVRLR